MRLKFSFPESYRAVGYSTHLTILHLSGQDRPAQGSYRKNSPTQCTSIVRYCVLKLRGRSYRMDTHLVLRMTGCSKARAWKTMRLTQPRMTSPHESGWRVTDAQGKGGSPHTPLPWGPIHKTPKPASCKVTYPILVRTQTALPPPPCESPETFSSFGKGEKTSEGTGRPTLDSSSLTY